MTKEYPAIYRLTSEGMELFQGVMTGQLDESALDALDPKLSQRVEGTSKLVVWEFPTAKDMAHEICNSFGNVSPQSLAGDVGLWAWLTFVLIDIVLPKEGGTRKTMELFRWFPAPPSDWYKAQRHLVRMPVLLFHAFGQNADHLICANPSVGPDIREQLTSQQDMFSLNFQRAARILYFDHAKGKVKRGAGSKVAGSPRRLATVRQQLDVTWDMTDLSAERILDLLPKEFDRFKSDGAAS